MDRIILIETSTALCSTALAENGVITSYKESSAPKAHASLTAVFIQEMLSERGLVLADCDAVCVSMGPGSYTGLRVGVSTAKGLCFGAAKPLLAVGTLDTLVAQACDDATPCTSDGSLGTSADSLGTSDGSLGTSDGSLGTSVDIPCQEPASFRYIIPMIDARRMEVYTAVFGKSDIPGCTQIKETGPNYIQITETAPMIIDENSFAEYLEQGPCLFIGDGAGKCADVIRHPNAHFLQCYPKASAMLQPALAASRAGDFKDVAYFEPFYLKEFVATVSKKKLF